MVSQQHRELAQNVERRCLGLGRVKSVYREIRQSWVSGLQMPSFFIETVQSGLLLAVWHMPVSLSVSLGSLPALLGIITAESNS
jgi:hypothetical protein